MGAGNHRAATGEALPGAGGKAAVAAEPAVLPGSGRTVVIPGTSMASRWGLGRDGSRRLPERSRLSGVAAAASGCAGRHGLTARPLESSGMGSLGYYGYFKKLHSSQ